MVQIKTIAKRNPQDLQAPEKFYAQPVYSGSVDLNELAYFASKQSTVSKADCYAVIISLLELVTYNLSEGKIVRMGDLGIFRVSVSSQGQDLAEDLTVSAIKKAKILFSPGADLNAMLKSLKYSKVQG
ncbi:HU family DNA-binding protein [Xanthomarina sp.]|uniref:HU family DNA-binding protein n=1 Tax=Xanthomarina sp. TaxID=1931211 RepID=UPI002BE204D8|nr:HU family DNA-binding protein [Xanthomarina sp.]HLV40546.1 HU family DNA-binding protein [Xanthomarina sp.]